MKTYKEFIDPYLNNFLLITIPEKKIKQIESFVTTVVKEKSNETEYKKDRFNKEKRFYTGTLGEAAIEELTQCQLIDWEIGNSSLFAEADLRKINLPIGVKTVEHGSFPIVHKKAKRPEIICIKISYNQILICGYATKAVLDKYQDDNLIKSPALKAKNTKTGFYGFDSLIPIKSLEGIKLNYYMEQHNLFY